MHKINGKLINNNLNKANQVIINFNKSFSNLEKIKIAIIRNYSTLFKNCQILK